ncbi:unnamed protein product [Microthlaspi erraticum]|uniref:Transposase-associated domain-containing protein n=1 Tax=Microthlaspi erraticum TaxID=1685480 RepID=A0A6D2INC5_9BRAS|nr:unnamed protein product [Microthlaspi erraticum]
MSSDANDFRGLMYHNLWDSSFGLRAPEFGEGLTEFMGFSTQEQRCLDTGRMFCPCPTCDNNKFRRVEKVWNHLYRRGFRENYKVWYFHGAVGNVGGSSGDFVYEHLEEPIMPVEEDSAVLMVNDAFREHIPLFIEDGNRIEEPNLEAMRFFYMLDAANHELYAGCRAGQSP